VASGALGKVIGCVSDGFCVDDLQDSVNLVAAAMQSARKKHPVRDF
jgi:hypothetical protein